MKANTVNYMALTVSLAEQLCGGSRAAECQQLQGCVLWALKWQIGGKGAGYTSVMFDIKTAILTSQATVAQLCKGVRLLNRVTACA